jgi:hypothetical protein
LPDPIDTNPAERRNSVGPEAKSCDREFRYGLCHFTGNNNWVTAEASNGPCSAWCVRNGHPSVDPGTVETTCEVLEKRGLTTEEMS